MRTNHKPCHSGTHNRHSYAAFTLVELLTVVFIISLLIGILIPSISSARTAAKRKVTQKAISSIEIGLEMFKNENGRDFPQTNGYPPSFSHPPIRDYTFESHLGEFPFLENKPKIYGAHWLPAMLIGPDANGYISKRTVSNKNEIRSQPEKWYTPDPYGDDTTIERKPLYIDANTRMLLTQDLPGRVNRSDFFQDWDPGLGTKSVESLPVIVDGFDQPLLYYAANRHGKVTNMVGDLHDKDNNYDNSTPQQKGVPYYFHQDNEGFTGSEEKPGWNFNGKHPLANSGAELTANEIILPENTKTFARYILDRKIYTNLTLENTVNPNAQLRPVNADTYLLISAGPDGRYGTNDDVSNLPPQPGN